MSAFTTIHDPIADKESFKHYYETIIENFNPVLYDDEFMNILAGKTNALKLNSINATKIVMINRNTNILNTFDESMESMFKEYGQLLILSKKILINFIKETSFLYHVYNNPSLLETKYLLNKYFDNQSVNVIINKNYDDLGKQLKDAKINSIKIISVTDDNLIDNIRENSSLIYVNKSQAIYRYYINTQLFVAMYNKIIQLQPGGYTIGIKIKTDYYIELIFDIITILRSYFKLVYLVNSKYNSRYNFVIVLKEKIKAYDSTDNITFTKSLQRVSHASLPVEYVDYMNKLYAKRADKIKTYMALEKLKYDDAKAYKLALEKIDNYRRLQN
jgi:hypothetical protein